MIEIHEVWGKNFISYEEFNLPINNGVYLVVGENRDSTTTDSNGSGKSAIFEAVIYALYGKSDREVKRKGAKECEVGLRFSVGSDEFTIIRSYQKRSDLQIYKNGELVSLHTKREKENYIQSIIGLSYENFISSIIIKQGFDVKLTALTPTQRKRYFSILVDLDFDNLLKKAKDKLAKYEKELIKIESEYESVKEQKQRIESQIELLSNMITDVDKNKVNELKEKLAQLDEEIKSISEQIDKVRSEERKKLMEVESEIFKLSKEYELYSKFKEGKCPLCGSKVDVDKKKIESITKKLLQLKEARKSIEAYFSNFISALTDKYNEKVKEYNQLNLELTQLLMKSDSANNVRMLEQLKQQLEAIEDKYYDLDFEYQNIKSKVDNYSKLVSLLQPSGELRLIVLESYIKMFNQILANIVEDLIPEFSGVKLILDGADLIIEGVNYKTLSGGEKRLLDIAFQIAFSDLIALSAGSDFNIRVYDEIFDGLDESALNRVLEFLIDYYADKAVYFISHNKLLKSQFSNIFNVVKENGVSRLEVC